LAKAQAKQDEAEYALQMADMVKGGAITLATFHGSDGLLQCEARLATARLQGGAAARVPAYCVKH
jgi:hypothetical protein